LSWASTGTTSFAHPATSWRSTTCNYSSKTVRFAVRKKVEAMSKSIRRPDSRYVGENYLLFPRSKPLLKVENWRNSKKI